MTLGKRIAECRLAQGMSQNELARRAGVNHPTLHKIESGQRKDPSTTIVASIARALGTTVEALLGYELEETRLVVDADKLAIALDVRSLASTKAARERARTFVVNAIERAGGTVREATSAAPAAGKGGRRSTVEAGRLATGGLALIDELQAVRHRLDALEAWRHKQEGRTRKRASR